MSRGKKTLILNYTVIKRLKKLLSSLFSSDSRRLLNNTSWVFFSNTYRIGLVFLRSIIVATALSAATFGEYATILALTLSLQAFFNTNIGTVFTKFGAGYMSENRNDKLFAMVKLSFTICIAVLLISLIVLYFFIQLSYDFFVDYPGLENHIIALSVAQGMIFINYISMSLLRLFYKFKQNSLINMLLITFELIVIVVALVVYSVGLETFLVIIIIQKFVSSIIFNVLCFWEIRDKLTGFMKVRINLIREDFTIIRSFIVINYGSRLLKTLLQQGDILLLGAFNIDKNEVGIFAVGKRLGNAILSITDPMMNAVFPQVSRMIADKQYGQLLTMIKQITISVTAVSGLILIPFYFFRFDLVALAFGSEYSEAGNVFFIMAIGAVIAGASFWYASLLINLELIVYRLKMYILLVLAGMLLGYLLIPAYGAIGAALMMLGIKILEVSVGAGKSIKALKARL